MKIARNKLNELSVEELFNKLISVSKLVYQDYSFMEIEEDFFKQICLMVISNDIKNIPDKYLNNVDFWYEIKLSNVLTELLKQSLEDNDKAKTILNNYIMHNFKANSDYSEFFRCLKKFTTFFTEIDYVPGIGIITDLIQNNLILQNALKIVIHKNKKNIMKNGLENLSDNEFLDLLFGTYCVINNIELNEIPEKDLANEDINEGLGNSKLDDSTNMYLREIGEIPLLSLEREKLLLLQMKNGSEAARQKLIESNLRLVVNIAKRYLGYGIPILDLIEEGNIGLQEAIDKFDLSKNTRISTYATFWIKAAITKYIAQNNRAIRLPRNVQNKINKYKSAVYILKEKLERTPAREEIAEFLGWPLKEVKKIELDIEAPISLNGKVGEDEDSELGDFVESVSGMVEDYESKELSVKIQELFNKSNLKKREKEVIILRYGLDGKGVRTLEEVGKILHVSRQRIKQIESNAINKLRDSKTISDFAIYTQYPNKSLENLGLLRAAARTENGKTKLNFDVLDTQDQKGVKEKLVNTTKGVKNKLKEVNFAEILDNINPHIRKIFAICNLEAMEQVVISLRYGLIDRHLWKYWELKSNLKFSKEQIIAYEQKGLQKLLNYLKEVNDYHITVELQNIFNNMLLKEEEQMLLVWTYGLDNNVKISAEKLQYYFSAIYDSLGKLISKIKSSPYYLDLRNYLKEDNELIRVIEFKEEKKKKSPKDLEKNQIKPLEVLLDCSSTEKEKLITSLKGQDLEIIKIYNSGQKLSRKEKSIFYNHILPLLKEKLEGMRLSDKTNLEEREPEFLSVLPNNEEIMESNLIATEYFAVAELLKTPNYINLLNFLPSRDAMILLMYSRNILTIKQIGESVDMKEEEVINSLRQSLLIYQKEIKNISDLDNLTVENLDNALDELKKI